MIPNAPVVSVSELSQSLKSMVEDKFGYVHVRGELSDVKVAASGHCYARLKDPNAVLDAIVWRTSMARLSVCPEEGLEVIATGKLTTYPGRSSYQIVIDRLEVAGEGALLKLIEDRRKKLAAEGLFDEARKRPIPQFPRRIGIVTSPTGAVIRDILHRLDERFPTEVWLLPVMVQGEGAVQQIADAINAFSRMAEQDRPDVVIVARGGGSLEDLMAFNDEAVVRAAANCPVPLISAVGHETDTTLIDYASDKRAPTPTAAAELATPHRGNLLAFLAETRLRLQQSLSRRIDDSDQRLDHIQFRLSSLIAQALDKAATRIAGLRPRSPDSLLQLQQQKLESLTTRIAHAYTRLIADQKRHADDASAQLPRLMQRLLEAQAQRLENASRMLQTVSFESILERGFVLVRDAQNRPLTNADDVHKGQDITLQFAARKTRKATISD